MPIYEYQCASCGSRIEIIQTMSEPPRTDCPHCNTPALRKLVSAAGFRLKGTGWYATDFKSKANGGKDNDADKKPGADASPDTATKSQTTTGSTAGKASANADLKRPPAADSDQH